MSGPTGDVDPKAWPTYARRIEPPGLARRWLAECVLGIVDAGWTVRTPLDTHVVICGFPRAGSTLLAAILQASYPAAKGYSHERTALRVAYATDRSHRLLISKRPDDVFWLDEIRQIYATRRPRVRFLLTMRDPRAILTSVHAGRPSQYYVSPDRWRATYAALVRNRHRADSLVIRFEDLISNAAAVQQVLTSFLGHRPERQFDQFVDHVPANYKQTALNGLRPLDRNAASKWRAVNHHDRLAEALRTLPELRRILIAEGYEPDTAWAQAYQDAPMMGATPSGGA